MSLPRSKITVFQINHKTGEGQFVTPKEYRGCRTPATVHPSPVSEPKPIKNSVPAFADTPREP